MLRKNLADKIAIAFNALDEFSAPLLAIGLSLMVLVETKQDRAINGLRDEILKAAKEAIAQNRRQWPTILRAMPKELNLLNEASLCR